jgi:dienelactone hydrolase/guanyl-specific ribonuclease Sa
MMRYVLLLALAAGGSSIARAEIVSRPVESKQGTTVLRGSLVLDPAGKVPRPGVLLAHERGPSSAAARSRAEQLAGLGYVVLSMDLYGQGAAPRDHAEALARLELTGGDRALVRDRTAAALATLAKLPQVDPRRLAAVGYGVGGTAVMELARSRADLEAVVCVHGDPTPAGDDGKRVGASVLVLVGADDPGLTLAQLAAFEEEMRSGGVDWQLIRYGGVAGEFTGPQAGGGPKAGRADGPDAERRAFEAIRLFLAEMLRTAASEPAPAAGPLAARPPKAATSKIPQRVLDVLEYVDRHGEAMPNYEGGRTFGNFERRLPMTDDRGRRIRYREWDVRPRRPGVNRGAERLVTGSDGKAYYTDDHYSSFQTIR